MSILTTLRRLIGRSSAVSQEADEAIFRSMVE